MEEYLPETMRIRLTDLMKQRKCTQAQLAEQTGVGVSTLSRFLTGETTRLSSDAVVKIARSLQVSTDFLLGETDVPDRTWYYAADLGLSPAAAEVLCRGKANRRVVSGLLEQESFQTVTRMVSGYLDDRTAAGFTAVNEMYGMLAEQLSMVPSAREELLRKRVQPVMAEEFNIQTMFITAVRELKAGDGCHRQQPARETMARILDSIISKASKGRGSVQPTITKEQVVDDVIQVVEQQCGTLGKQKRKAVRDTWNTLIQVLAQPHE